MGAADRRYGDEGIPRDVAAKETAAMGALAHAVAKAGHGKEVADIMRRRLTELDLTSAAGEMAAPVLERALDVLALHVRRLTPTGGTAGEGDDDGG